MYCCGFEYTDCDDLGGANYGDLEETDCVDLDTRCQTKIGRHFIFYLFSLTIAFFSEISLCFFDWYVLWVIFDAVAVYDTSTLIVLDPTMFLALGYDLFRAYRLYFSFSFPLFTRLRIGQVRLLTIVTTYWNFAVHCFLAHCTASTRVTFPRHKILKCLERWHLKQRSGFGRYSLTKHERYTAFIDLGKYESILFLLIFLLH